jgi:HSP20 family protein
MAKEKAQEKEVQKKKGTSLEPWDPFRELDLFRGWPAMRSLAGLREGLPALERWSPSMDVSESDTHYVVTVELAGANKDDVSVEVQDGVLTVRGEKKSEREEKGEERRYVERSYGMFSRSFTLPANANEDDVKATMSDGVLSVEIAKRDEPKPKAVKIH